MRYTVDEGYAYQVFYHTTICCYEIKRKFDNVSVLFQGDDALIFEKGLTIVQSYQEYSLCEEEALMNHKDDIDMLCGTYDNVMGESECTRRVA